MRGRGRGVDKLMSSQLPVREVIHAVILRWLKTARKPRTRVCQSAGQKQYSAINSVMPARSSCWMYVKVMNPLQHVDAVEGVNNQARHLRSAVDQFSKNC